MSHGGFLRQHSDDPELSSHIMHDYTQADLDEQTRGMLDFAVKLPKNPSGSKKAAVDRLRDLGLSDQPTVWAWRFRKTGSQTPNGGCPPTSKPCLG